MISRSMGSDAQDFGVIRTKTEKVRGLQLKNVHSILYIYTNVSMFVSNILLPSAIGSFHKPVLNDP